MKLKLVCAALGLTAALMGPSLHAEDLAGNAACPKHATDRTDAKVLQAHLAAFQAGNAQLIGCDFSKDALLVLPNTIAHGQAEIRAAFAGFFSLTGGNIVVTTRSLTLTDGVALIEYSIDSDHVVVADAVDTFVIEDGAIVTHTARLGGLSFK